MAVNVTPQETPPVAGKQTRGRHDTEIGIRMSATHGNTTEYRRCKHDASCCFKSTTGWCVDHCREFGCHHEGDRVRHDDRRGERSDQLIDTGTALIAAKELLQPSTRKGRR